MLLPFTAEDFTMKMNEILPDARDHTKLKATTGYTYNGDGT